MYYIFAIEFSEVSEGVRIELSCLLTDPVSTLSEATRKFKKAIKFSKKERIACGLYYGGRWLEVWLSGDKLLLKKFLNDTIRPKSDISYKVLDVGI